MACTLVITIVGKAWNGAGYVAKPFVRMHGSVPNPIWLCDNTRVGSRPRITESSRRLQTDTGTQIERTGAQWHERNFLSDSLESRPERFSPLLCHQ